MKLYIRSLLFDIPMDNIARQDAGGPVVVTATSVAAAKIAGGAAANVAVSHVFARLVIHQEEPSALEMAPGFVRLVEQTHTKSK